MRLGYLAIALALSAASASDSWSQSKQPPTQSKQSAQPPAADQRGTDQVPLTVKIIPAQDAKEKADKEERERQEKAVIDEKLAFETQRIADYTDRLAAFTIALFCVAIFQAGLFFWQLRYMRQGMRDAEMAAKAAQDSADAAKESVTLAKETAQQQLRAYLFIKTPKILVFNADKTCAHEMWIRNYGQTPAHDVVAVTNTDFFEPDIVLFPKLDEPKQISKSSLAPSGEVIFTTVTDDPLTADQLNSVASGKRAFFVWGEITYTDVFGCPQTTHFRLRFGKAQLRLGSGAMMVCNEGNQAT
jgi:hypothetical protein